ncbi:YhcH/YjgK/YiaL family protein [Halodesulfovibrio marinisediminis]|uniref:YhcH/YjgK/YiaL family protein n=1 Tax=Halodesulfovibrio marinisediminis DSM 17456 TaxID=1121457 RepID=A0A1N6GQN0_9BACT|nr:YhcH/YjgK/YiaL family protein [Halodesulfovibrio marinisediminis]SIO09830.1 YhcH/YjgK/YiaL family protein [Halodesulfovibrio marinisediminis DSM 17456]
MILDVLEHAERYEALSPYFAEAFAFLRRKDLYDLPDGQYEIQGRKLYATVVHQKGRSIDEAKLEAHDQYIDIQFVLQGTELMGWKSRKDITVPAEQPEEYPDVYFYDEAPTSWNTVLSGSFAIFFPEDAHMPLVADGELHKVILKVAVDSE